VLTFDSLRRKVGTILGQSVPVHSLEAVMKETDTQGRVQNKQLIALFVAMYNYLEENEPSQPTNQAQSVGQNKDL
jgi:hypothetical protein